MAEQDRRPSVPFAPPLRTPLIDQNGMLAPNWAKQQTSIYRAVTRYRITIGIADDIVGTNKVGKYGNILAGGQVYDGGISCVTSPTTADTIIDVLYSKDDGTTWTSLFRPGNANKIVYPIGTLGCIVIPRPITFEMTRVNDMKGALIRVDSLQSGGALGIEIDLRVVGSVVQ